MLRNRLFREIFVLTAIFLTGTLSGCGRTVRDEKVLALIGEDKITAEDFNDRISHLPERYRKVVKKRKAEYLQELISDTLLYQEAVRVGLSKDREVLKIIEVATTKIIIARYLKDNVYDKIVVTEEEIAEKYKAGKASYKLPEVMRVSHILTHSREKAEEILEEIKNGAVFEDLARAKSIDPTAQNGGDIGYFPLGQLMPEFERACSNLEQGEISGVVKTKLGYHIIKLTDRKEPTYRPLEKVGEKIRAEIRASKRRTRFNDLLNELREKTDIEVYDNVLEDGVDQVEGRKNEEK